MGKRILRDGVQRSPRAGWQHVHVAVDDHTRLAYAEVLLSDRRADALAFLERALRWFAAQGITVEEVMTDNGSAYRSRAWRVRCEQLGLRHLRLATLPLALGLLMVVPVISLAVGLFAIAAWVLATQIAIDRCAPAAGGAGLLANLAGFAIWAGAMSLLATAGDPLAPGPFLADSVGKAAAG